MRPDYPPGTQPELAAVLDYLYDALEEEGLTHEEEGDPLAPDLWTVTACDCDGHINMGFVGWSDEVGLSFVAFNMSQANHDEAEGVSDDDSRCWWNAQSADNLLLHLTGQVRRIVRKVGRG